MVASENDPGGVSWEERRKGLPPERPKGPDWAIWAERYASERQTYNLPGVSWVSTNTGIAADYAQDLVARQLGSGEADRPDALPPDSAPA